MSSAAAQFRYVADECLAASLVADLRAAGLDVEWIHDLDPSAPDPRVLTYATERQRILITHDFDFGGLTIKDNIPAMGVVILALQKLSRNARSNATLEALELHVGTLVGSLLIVEPGRVRSRPLSP